MSEEQKSPRKMIEVAVGQKVEGDVDPKELRATFTNPPPAPDGSADVEGRWVGWQWVVSPWGNYFWVYLYPGKNVFYDYIAGGYFYVYG